MTTPFSLYQADLLKSHFFEDDAQLQAITKLQRLYDDLLQAKTKSVKRSSLLQRVFGSNQVTKQSIQGLYFYGGVGRGKTYLVDLFFHSINSERKRRLHFHHFMLEVHEKLTLLQGQVNPLKEIAKQFSEQVDIICFDEFFVEDITDAMILAGVFEALFEQGVVLVATSNIHPDNLYKNGLQRARFLPAIDLINQHCEVFNLDGGKDYRLDRLIESEIYHYPLDGKALSQIEEAFEMFASGEKSYGKSITINHRSINTVAFSCDTLSMEFTELCGGPRNVSDYIKLAASYHTVLIANVPMMTEQHNDLTRRFIALVDEFYDSHIVLIISAEVDVLNLYQGTRLAFEFQRCISRLLEMQSEEYLGKTHL